MTFQLNQFWKFGSTSPHSGRQNVAQGEASAASGTLGHTHNPTRARFSGRQMLVSLVILFVGGATACNRGAGTANRASLPAEVSNSAQVVKVTTSPTHFGPHVSANAIIKLSISPGYHINANPATYPYLIATEMTGEKVDGVVADAPKYPIATHQKFQFAEEPLAVYEGDVEIILPLRVENRSGEFEVPITVRVQACDNEKCFPPANVNASIPLVVKL